MPLLTVTCRNLVAKTINKGQALQLRATRETLDKKGQKRVAGQEWLIREPGNYMIGPYEEIVKTISSTVLNDHTALHLKAKDNFTDFLGNERKIGDRWLITKNETNSFIPSVHEELENTVTLITLTSREFCIVENPVDETLKNQHGKKILRKGECSFFLHPDEAIPHGVEDVHVLSEHDGLILRADEEFEDGENGTRQPGDRWMIKGPCEYVPPVEVSIVRNHRSIPLDETEGIYVRDIKSGKVRAVVGETYMLTENEELWEKKLPKMVEVNLKEPLLTRKRKHSDVEVSKFSIKVILQIRNVFWK
jgi:major vault protein